MLAQVTELRTALHSEKLERQEVEAEFAEMADRAKREANEAASKAEARAAELERQLKRTMEVRIQCISLKRPTNIKAIMDIWPLLW